MYGYPKIWVAHGYFVIAFLVGVVFILINNTAYGFPLAVEMIVAALYLAIYMMLMIMEEHSIASDKVDARDNYFVKNASMRLETARRAASSTELKKTIEKVYDAVRNTQVKSIKDVRPVEDDILAGIDALTEAAGDGKLQAVMTESKNVLSLIKKRDNMIRLSR